MGPANIVILDKFGRIVGPALPGEALVAIEELTRPRGILNRKLLPSALLANLRPLAEEHGLRGLTLVEQTAADPIPPPFVEYFEPVALNARDPQIDQIAPARPQVSRWPRIFGIGVAGAVGLSFFFSFRDILTDPTELRRLFTSARVGVAALALFAAVIVWGILSKPKWYLVPAGVWVVARAGRGGLVRREDAVTYVGRADTDGSDDYFVEIRTRSRAYESHMNDRAIRAFLAAWQSPLPPPDEAQIREYFGSS